MLLCAACTFQQLRDPNFCASTGKAIVTEAAASQACTERATALNSELGKCLLMLAMIVQGIENRTTELFEDGLLDPVLVSITLGKLGAELPGRIHTRFTEAMNKLRDRGYFEEGVCMTERGDTNFRKHIQGMIVMRINNGLSMDDASAPCHNEIHAVI